VGLRFQRRIKVLPGVRINLSKSGVGFSVGGRGAHIEASSALKFHLALFELMVKRSVA